VALLSNTQIIGLSSTQVSQLTTTQVGALNTIAAFGITSNQIAALTTSQVIALSTSFVSTLMSNQTIGLSTSDLKAMTTTQTAAMTFISPLVLDLTGVDALTSSNLAGLAPSAFSVLTSTQASSGVQTQTIGQSGVTFDLGNTGATNANVGWITPGEGFLVNLPQGATTITNGSQLFGTATVLPNGQTASNGFAALSAFDQNGSGVIDAGDPIFNQLQVWVDTGTGGADGTTPTGTLFSLAQLNIQSLNLSATVANQSNNGNLVGLVSSYTTTDGKTHELADVWFASTAGTGSSVSQLSQALSQYNANGTSSNAANPGLLTNSPASTVSSSTAASTSVLASALSQYNSNGQLLANTAPVTQDALSPSTATRQLIGQVAATQATITKNGGSGS